MYLNSFSSISTRYHVFTTWPRRSLPYNVVVAFFCVTYIVSDREKTGRFCCCSSTGSSALRGRYIRTYTILHTYILVPAPEESMASDMFFHKSASDSGRAGARERVVLCLQQHIA